LPFKTWTWGDGDEGQLGDGYVESFNTVFINFEYNFNFLSNKFVLTPRTTNSIQRPRLISSLGGKNINRVATGSAHTLAWSTTRPSSSGHLPREVPMEYDLLQEIPLIALRNRLLLLHYFSDIFCPIIPMWDADSSEGGNPNYDPNKLRGILVSNAKETAFRKIIHGTMVRDKQHGPVIELNRIQVKKSRGKGGLAGPEGIKSVFGQMVTKMHLLTQNSLLLPHRIWKVKFVGESVDDCGGEETNKMNPLYEFTNFVKCDQRLTYLCRGIQ